MSNGLDQVPDSSYSSKVRAHYSAQESTFLAPNLEKSAKNGLSIDRHPPSNAISYQEVADTRFNSIEKDYAQARILYTDKAMKGRGSKRLDGFPVILWDLKSFIKWVKAEAERVAFEVTVTRRIKYHEDHWTHAKQAFQAELERINQQRQAKH